MAESKKLPVDRGTYLTFNLDSESYAIEISKVKEIIALMKTTKVPKMPKYIKGVMNLRGIIIPVIDLRLKFQMQEVEPQMHTAIIIIQIESSNIGFVVDRVEEVISIENEKLTDAPKFGTKVDTEFIKAMAQIDTEVVMILDLEKVLDEDEINWIENIHKEN
jgi:purine-binding chemotaxis protein CheW